MHGRGAYERALVGAMLLASLVLVMPLGHSASAAATKTTEKGVDDAIAQTVRSLGLVDKIYEDTHKGKPLPPDNASPATKFEGRLVSQGMVFSLPDEIPTKGKVVFQTVLKNCSDREGARSVTISKTTTEQDAWANTRIWDTSIGAEFKLRRPFVGETDPTVNANLSASDAATVRRARRVTWNAKHRATIAPQQQVTVQLVLAEQTHDVPYKVDFIANGAAALTIHEPASGGTKLRWEPANEGFVPANAVLGGSETDRRLYVCRASHNSGQHPGKIVSGHCYFSSAGETLRRQVFEVLVLDSGPYRWQPASNGERVENEFVAGWEPGRKLVLCRASHNKGIYPGKVVDKACHFSAGNQPVRKSKYEVIVTTPPDTPRDQTLSFVLEDYLQLKDRVFSVEGMYHGVRAERAYVRVGPPQRVESCQKNADATPVDVSKVEELPQRHTVKRVVPGPTQSLDSPLSLQDPPLRGDDVSALQQALGKSGATVNVDGVFDESTDVALRHFQKENGLQTDGVVGSKTRQLLGL